MARPKTASSILDARGAFRKNPQRRRPNEPKVTAQLRRTPPKYLTKEQKTCWKEVTKLAPAGVLTAADAIAVEVVACLLAEFRANPVGMPASRITRLTTEMKTLGLNPSGRAGLTVPSPPSDDEFDDF